MIGAYIVRVLEPPHVTHVPQALAIRNEPLTVTAASNCSSSQCPATLTWTDGTGVEKSTPMTGSRVVGDDDVPGALPGDVWEYTATIPGTDTAAPFRYSISVTDGYTSDTTPTYSVQVAEVSPLPLMGS